MSIFEGVQHAVGIFFYKLKVRNIPLLKIVSKVPKEADSWLIIGKNEASEVTGEALHTNANGNKIEIFG